MAYKFVCDLCKKDVDQQPNGQPCLSITVESLNADARDTYVTMLKQCNVDTCEECSNSFIAWVRSRQPS